MDVQAEITVFFEDPFWVAVCKRHEEGKLFAAKVTFGPEPTEAMLYPFFLEHYRDLRFGPAADGERQVCCRNPKRLQRQIQRQLDRSGAGTKAQQAIQAQQQLAAAQRKTKRRERAQSEKQQAFERRRQKRKEKHKGH